MRMSIGGCIFVGFCGAQCAMRSLQEERAKVCLMWKLDSLNPSLLIFHKLQQPPWVCHTFLIGNKYISIYLLSISLFPSFLFLSLSDLVLLAAFSACPFCS